MSIINVEHLTKDYGFGRGVFDVSFEVNKGEVFGFLGPNGAGKSTTIRHIMGFSKPDSGQTTVFDKNTFEILVLIELNDNSHLAQNRQARDIKVKQILEEAHIPLITLWTTYDNSAIYIKNRLKEFIDI